MSAAQRIILVASNVDYLVINRLDHDTTHGLAKMAHTVMRSDSGFAHSDLWFGGLRQG